MSRPAAPEPRAGAALFVVAFVLSPLVLVAWFCGAALLRVTGWPRWRVALAALAAGGLVVVVQGGPVPALQAHFSGLWSLLSEFGRPVVHLPTPGAFLAVQAPLAAPAGLLLATVQRPGVALEGPDPAAATRARRREERQRRQARRLVGKSTSPTARKSASSNVLGVSLGGDLDAWRAGRYVVLPDHAARLPRLVIGLTGSGKSTYIGREVHLAGQARRQSVILDGKGDRSFADAVVDAYLAAWPDARVLRFPDEPLDCWRGGPAAQVNRFIGVWPWTAESDWYRELAVLALRLALGAPGQPCRSTAELVARLDPAALARLWKGHPTEAGLVKTMTPKLGDVAVRVSNLAASLGGLLDGQRAIEDADLVLISIPTMGARNDSEATFRVVAGDVAHWAAVRKPRGRPGLAVVDEFSAVTGAREPCIDLMERGRSALVPTLLSAQSYAGLGNEQDRDRILSATASLVLFASNQPDELAKLAGSYQATEAVYAVEDGVWTGRASVTSRHRAKVDPNMVRQLGVGEAVVISRGRAERMLVIPAPDAGARDITPARTSAQSALRSNPLPAFPPSPAPGRPTGEDQPRAPRAPRGNPAPTRGPAGAVDEREVPGPAQPRQGQAPTGSPAASLDPPGPGRVRRQRPPQVGPGNPPDDRNPKEAP